MNSRECITRANDLYDARSLRLRALHAVAVNLAQLHGDGTEPDEQQAALWWLVGEEVDAAERAMREICELVRGGDDGA